MVYGSGESPIENENEKQVYKVDIQFVDKVGNVKTEESKIATVAKIITTMDNDKEMVHYKIATYRGSLYKPSGIYSNRENALKQSFVFKRVDKDVFDNYFKYLQTKKEIYYTYAERGFINV